MTSVIFGISWRQPVFIGKKVGIFKTKLREMNDITSSSIAKLKEMITSQLIFCFVFL